MQKIKAILFLFVLVFGFLGGGVVEAAPQQSAKAEKAAPAVEETKPATPGLSLPKAPFAAQLGQTIQTLVGGDVGASDGAVGAPKEGAEEAPVQIQYSWATGLLNASTKALVGLRDRVVFNEKVLEEFTDWFELQSTSTRRRAFWATLAQDLLVVIVPPLLVGSAVMLFFIPLRLRFRRRKPGTLSGRIGLLFGLFLLRLAPVLVFLGGALLLLSQNETERLPRFVLLNLIYALSLGYTIQQILRGIFAPTTPHLRLLGLSTPQAVSAYRWSSVFIFVIVYSYFFLDIATALRISSSVARAFQSLVAVFLTVLAVIAIARLKGFVAAILRGDIQEKAKLNFVENIRVRLSRHWHKLATAYLLVSLGAILLGIENSMGLMLRGTVLSVGALVVARYAFVGIEHWRVPVEGEAVLLHRQILAFVLRGVVWILAAVGIAMAWGCNVSGFLATPFGQRLSGGVISIALTLTILTVLYEIIHAAIDRYLQRREEDSDQPVASARAQTLLPMVRASIFVLFAATAILTCLSVVGVNIGPLLAGAGVLGVAIGFGSQTLVKDFLTGLFIVAENSIAVGDVVRINDASGGVEALSIRTIRLRDLEGALHILPFSEVTNITNFSRGFAYAMIDIGVAYDSDLDHVMRVMREVGDEIKADPIFKRVVLEPIEVMGVNEWADSSVNLRARIRTRPGKQWEVRRLLLLRLKQRFDKEGIEIPFPTVVHVNKGGA